MAKDAVRWMVIFLVLFVLIMMTQIEYATPPGMKAPWTAGMTYLCSQGNFGEISHTYPDTLYAWDFKLPHGTPVRAAADGWVYEVCYNCDDFGNKIKIEHVNRYLSLYAHLSEILVIKGQKIRRGQLVGFSGATGSVGAPHLHFSMMTKNNYSVPSAFTDIGIPTTGDFCTSQNLPPRSGCSVHSRVL